MAGSVSGLSTTTNQIVQQLMSIERRPLDALSAKQSSYQTKISSLGKISSALDAVKTAADALKTTSSSSLYAATSSNKDMATATVSGTKASAASYDLEVTQLAKSQKLASKSFTTADDAVGSGSLTISIAGKADQTVNVGAGSTLTQLRDAINSQSTGVKASIVQAADGFKLSLTSESGEKSAVKITANDDDGNNTDTAGLSAFAYDPTALVNAGKNMVQNQAAQDTKGKIDGIDVVSSTTKITSAPGVTIDVKTTGTSTINVAVDNTSYTDKTKAFVEAYNKAIQTIRSEGRYNADTGAAGALNGSRAVRGADSELTKLKQTQLTGDIKNLTDAGIVSNADGTLRVDTAKLNKALEKPDALASFWGTSGFNAKVSDAITGLTSTSGVIGLQKDTYGNAIKTIDAQKEQLNVRLEMIEKRYTAQYSKLESLTSNASSIINLFA